MTRVFRVDAGTLQKPRRTSQGYLRVDGWASRTGILEYRNPDGTIRRELREPDAVFDESSLLGFEGAPITDDHPSTMVDIHNAKQLTKGHVLSVGRRDGDHVAVSLVVTDPELIRKMENGKRQLSTGYYVELDETPGTHPQYGRYDARQVRVGPVNHLAVVERGRAGTASVRMDAAMDVRLDPGSEQVPAEVVARLDAIAAKLDALHAKRDHGDHDQEDHGRRGGGGGGEKSGGGAKSGGGGDKRTFAEIRAQVSKQKKEMSEYAKAFSDENKAYDAVAKKYGAGEAQVWRALTRDERGRDFDSPATQAKPSPPPSGPSALLGDGPGRSGKGIMGGDPSKEGPSVKPLDDNGNELAGRREPPQAEARPAQGDLFGAPPAPPVDEQAKARDELLRKVDIEKAKIKAEQQAEREAKRQAEGDKPKPKLPTYAKAKSTVIDGLEKRGWTVKKDLKIPHATSPDGQTRLWFKPQAMWVSRLGGGDKGIDPVERHDLKHAGSNFADIRKYAEDDGIEKLHKSYSNRGRKPSQKTDTAHDLHSANSVPKYDIMDLEAALARIKELEAKLAALQEEPAASEDEGEHSEDDAPKMDAANIARLEGERDAARKDAEDAAKAHADELAKVRKDADARVREALDVLTKARAILGADAKVKLDGKNVDLLDAPLRAIKCAVIKRVDSDDVGSDKHDAYVDALFERAVKTASKGADSVAKTLATVAAPATPARTDAATASDPELDAARKLREKYQSAWMAGSTDDK